MTECKHNWLTPGQDRTVCTKCGRDGYIYLDVDVEQRCESLQRENESLHACILKIRKALTGDIHSTDHLIDKIEELKAERDNFKLLEQQCRLGAYHEIETMRTAHDFYKRGSEELLRQNKIMREALEFYAEMENWFGPIKEDDVRYFKKIHSTDCDAPTATGNYIGGKRARAALAEVDKESNETRT